jgi:hypothetical protein
MFLGLPDPDPSLLYLYGSGSFHRQAVFGSVSQWYGSADPDPYQTALLLAKENQTSVYFKSSLYLLYTRLKGWRFDVESLCSQRTLVPLSHIRIH